MSFHGVDCIVTGPVPYTGADSPVNHGHVAPGAWLNTSDRTTASARALLAQGRLAEACIAIDATIASMHPPTVEALMLRAHILLTSASFQPAIVAFQRVVAAAPAAAAAEFGLAVALFESGSSAAAVLAARRVIAKGLDTAGVRFVLGRALFDAGCYEDAESEFRQLVNRWPDHQEGQTNLADLAWMRTGDIAASTAALDEYMAAVPSVTAPRIIKARLLESAGFAQRAYEELAIGIEAAQGSAELHLAAAQASVGWDCNRALVHAEQAVRIAPDDANIVRTHAHTLMAAGFPARALVVAERLLAANPHDSHATALKSSALRLLGDAAVETMVDYTRDVRACLLDVPNGWSTLAGYLEDLAASLHARHDRLRAHPVAQTLRHGTQVALRLDGADEAPIRAFPTAINGPIRRYIECMDGAGGVPRRHSPRGFRVSDAWSVRLHDGGFHFNHYHGKGWISSACYIDVPKDVTPSSGAGWLQFGEPGMTTTPALPAEYFVKPEPGLLVLFPSWMWHGTVPFSARDGDHRLSVAFDVIPRG